MQRIGLPAVRVRTQQEGNHAQMKLSTAEEILVVTLLDTSSATFC
jgi:hypothetical protein